MSHSMFCSRLFNALLKLKYVKCNICSRTEKRRGFIIQRNNHAFILVARPRLPFGNYDRHHLVWVVASLLAVSPSNLSQGAMTKPLRPSIQYV